MARLLKKILIIFILLTLSMPVTLQVYAEDSSGPELQAVQNIESAERLGNLPPVPESGEKAPKLEDWGDLPPLAPLEEDSKEEAHTVWTCSMHPNIQLPEFGQCPICFMDLIEVAVDSGSLKNLRQIALGDDARKLAQIETTAVKRGKAATSIRMVGKIDYDETLVSSITAWINGRIDKLHVDYTGSMVRSGQPMAEIYSPELLAAQAELIEAVAAAKKMNGSNNTLVKQTIDRTESAARKKLGLLGLTDEQIQEVIARKTPADHVTLKAPISGIVISKEVNEGMYIKTGSPIYTIADLTKLWVILEAYESDLYAIQLGQHVEFSPEAYPGKMFSGTVSYIDPVVNNKTRTIRVRLNIDNPELLLKPGMFVRATAKSNAGDQNDLLPLLIPASAPLLTGKRAIVYVQPPDQKGVYEGREIVLGPRHGEFYQVINGLTEGELVVTRGNFKIDSAIQIQGRPSMMNPFIASETTDPADLPPLFGSKLTLLNETFARMSKAIHDGDRKASKKYRRTFTKILTGIKSDFFEKDIKLDWEELAMVLKADMVLLDQAEEKDEELRTYAEMAEHFYQVRTRYQLSPPMLAKKGTDEIRDTLAGFLNTYLDFRKNLADDAEAKALANVPAILGEIDRFTSEIATLGPDESDSIQTELTNAAGQLKNSKKIAELRTGFYPLSKGLVKAVENFGVSSTYPVYKHYCPMAFNDTGAYWLDTSEIIHNPYFGDEMLRCGEVQSQYKAEDED